TLRALSATTRKRSRRRRAPIGRSRSSRAWRRWNACWLKTRGDEKQVLRYARVPRAPLRMTSARRRDKKKKGVTVVSVAARTISGPGRPKRHYALLSI